LKLKASFSVFLNLSRALPCFDSRLNIFLFLYLEFYVLPLFHTRCFPLFIRYDLSVSFHHS
jgi:hypothetical protein